MEKNIPFKIKAIALAGVALGTLSGCGNNSNQVEAGDTGTASTRMSLKTNVLNNSSNYCDINKGQNVELVRRSYVDYGTYKEPVTLIKSDECSGWTSDSNLSKNFEWNK